MYNKLAQIFYKLVYRAILIFWFFTRPTIQGVYVAIWYKGKLLIIKNSYRKRFTIPCGRIKPGENLADAAVRESAEEVGLNLEKQKLTFVGRYTGQYKYVSDIGHFFEIEMTELPVIKVDNREVVWADFMPIEEVYRLNLSPTVKTWLKNR
jgi:ADP-ribose pyrophosphatase YjhB (NUDIX family)